MLVRAWLFGLIFPLLFAGCVQLPPSPQDIAAKRFEIPAGKAAIYLVREYPDFSTQGATVMLDDEMAGTTYPGTYLRWEVAPGTHRIAGFAGDSGVLTLPVEANRVYFVKQSVRPMYIVSQSFFWTVDAGYGRQAVMRSDLAAVR